MIKRGHTLREGIDHWVFLHAEFRDLALSKSDWKQLEQLEKILGVTLQMSHADTPTIPWVLPMYWLMEYQLCLVSEDMALPLSFREAATVGINKLEKYHTYAKNNLFYVVATACHPAMRLNWFGPPDSDEYERASTIFQHIYEEYSQSTHPPTSGLTSPSKPNNRNLPSNTSFLQSCLTLGSSFDDLGSGTLTASEYDRYTRGDGGAGDIEKLLGWWKEHSTSKEGFPVISRIACDFLAIPSASVSVERLFSSLRHLCSDLRSSLKAETTTSAMCTKQWLKQGMLEFDVRRLISSQTMTQKKTD
ncbi:hypothetical protein D9758_018924 [Tetrapyrgos nigripes]|uniref:HAT C-terminal dimerisation domain-containing protein n=1 Tax=Tetrapyrgos nigripes TaxID=182062 RepID=A0A8H5EV91_9AGAR|nr:hypothetical protein D9758_018924 [Tetrapyrgos nigripes]